MFLLLDRLLQRTKILRIFPSGGQGWVAVLMGQVTPIFLESSLAGDEEVMPARRSIWWLLK